MVELRRFRATEDFFSLEKAIAAVFLPLLTTGIPSVRHLYLEPAQVKRVENLIEADGTPLQGPALWMIKHESKFDFLAAPPLWKLVPGDPLIKGVSRDKYASSPIMSWLIRELMRPLFFETYRLSDNSALTDAEKRQLMDKNRKSIERLRESYRQRIHAGIAPEGTTKTDGRIGHIRSGAYNLSHIMTEDGMVEVVPCVPIGNTYDFMAGEKNFWGRRKYAVFFRFGTPFFYNPVARDAEESDSEYVKRDIQYFAEQVELAFIDLNTITASQLVGDYILKLAEQRNRDTLVTPGWIERVLTRRVEQLRQIDGLYFDESILTGDGRKARAAALHGTLHELGYLSGVNALFLEEVLCRPENLEFFKDNAKGGNLLLYSANRIRQVAEITPAVDAVLRTHVL